MPVLRSHLDTASESYRANRTAMAREARARSRRCSTRRAPAAASATSRATTRAASCSRASASSCCSTRTRRSSSSRRSRAPTTEYKVGASLVTGVGVIEGTECVLLANDPTSLGGSINPYTLAKMLRAYEISLENRLPLAVPGRVGRRGPAAPGRGLHPGRRDVPEPHALLGRARADDLARVRQLDRRRRVPARHVRLRGDGEGARQGVPRRAAAREDGDRRGRERRGARRRRDARAHLRASPTTWRVDERDALRLGRRIVARLHWREARPRPERARRASRATTPRSCSGSRPPTSRCRSRSAR